MSFHKNTSIPLFVLTVFVVSELTSFHAQLAYAADVESGALEISDENDAWYFHLFSQQRYRFRTANSPALDAGDTQAQGDEADHDLSFYLLGQTRSPDDQFSAEISLMLWSDVDGVPDDGQTAFSSLYDEWGAVWFDVYSLQAEYRTRDFFRLVRAGRQVAEHGLPTTFDGAALELELLAPYLTLYAFGGRTQHFFELDDSLFEDWLGSAGFTIRPLPYLRIEVDYRFSWEDTTAENELLEHSYGVTTWFRHDDWMYLKAYVRGLNDAVSHTGLGARFIWSRIELGVDASLDAQPSTLYELSEMQDPYTAVLGKSLPHLRSRVDLWKQFTTALGTYTIHVGHNGRVLLGDEPGPFNREYGRVYLLFSGIDMFVKGPYLNLQAEYHYLHDSDDGLWTVGAAAGYDADMFKTEVGTAYHLFKYDYFADAEERSDVRSVYVQLCYAPLSWLAIKLRYEYEVFDRDVHTLNLTLSQTY